MGTIHQDIQVLSHDSGARICNYRLWYFWSSLEICVLWCLRGNVDIMVPAVSRRTMRAPLKGACLKLFVTFLISGSQHSADFLFSMFIHDSMAISRICLDCVQNMKIGTDAAFCSTAWSRTSWGRLQIWTMNQIMEGSMVTFFPFWNIFCGNMGPEFRVKSHLWLLSDRWLSTDIPECEFHGPFSRVSS